MNMMFILGLSEHRLQCKGEYRLLLSKQVPEMGFPDSLIAQG